MRDTLRNSRAQLELGLFTYSGWGDYWFEYYFDELPPKHFFRITAVVE